jgi:hypothetical protein
MLAQQGHVLEARILCRCLYESLLWTGALRERGFAFVQDMIHDEAFNRKALGELTLKISSRHGRDVGDEYGLQLRGLIREIAERFPKTQKLRVDKIAAEGPIETFYVEYLRLSLDAAHCSVTALGRHLVSERVGDKRVELMVTVEPTTQSKELLDTLLHLCRALIGVAIGANEILGFTSVSGRLGALVSDFEKNGWAAAN